MIKYRGVLTCIDQVNSNGTVFTREAVESAIKEFNESSKDRTLLYLDFPRDDGQAYPSFKPSIAAAKGVVRDFQISENTAVIDVEVLDVEHADIVQGMLDSKKFKFSQIADAECVESSTDGTLIVKKMSLRGVTLTEEHAANVPPPERIK